MIAFCNGEFLPEHEAKVSVFDRGFLYGDGIFETIRICQGAPFRWDQHLERLREGASALRIRVPIADKDLAATAQELVRRNQLPEAILRITLSRGAGRRGYSPAGADQPTIVMTVHAALSAGLENPGCWRIVTSSLRASSGDPLALLKSASKLPQVLARAEAEARGADEALFLNGEGEATEGASANLFWIEHGTVWTTPLTSPALPGVTRRVVLDLCRELAVPFAEGRCPLKRLWEAEGVFLTLTSLGIVEGVSLDGQQLSRSPLTRKLHRAYQQLVVRESGSKG
jgi:branched-chain amino acid aminotransferase